jgi:hypothetical protein
MASNQHSWQSNDGAVPLMLEVQWEFTPVSGLLPTVEVYRATDHFFADWSSKTFKSPSTSGDKYGSMSEVPSDQGLYQRNFNPVDFGQNLPIQSFYVRYKVTIPSGTAVGQGSQAETLIEDLNLQRSEIHNFRDMVGSGVQEQLGLDFSFGCS